MRSILTVDIGNTAVKVGVFDVVHSPLEHDQHAIALGKWLRVERRLWSEEGDWLSWLRGFLRTDEDVIIAISVVPARLEELRNACATLPEFGGATQLITLDDDARDRLPVRLSEGLTGLGDDRLIAIASAYAQCGGPTIAVTVGTATTLTVVDAHGVVMGGAIAPGLQISAGALAQHGAQLFDVPMSAPATAIATNTHDALQSGIVLGHAAMIDGLLSRMECEIGAPVSVVLTGGWAGAIAPHLTHAHHLDPELILRGLLLCQPVF